jgi:hypothetical protein
LLGQMPTCLLRSVVRGAFTACNTFVRGASDTEQALLL